MKDHSYHCDGFNAGYKYVRGKVAGIREGILLPQLGKCSIHAGKVAAVIDEVAWAVI